MLELEILDRIEGLYKATMPMKRQGIGLPLAATETPTCVSPGGGAALNDTYAIVCMGHESYRCDWEGQGAVEIAAIGGAHASDTVREIAAPFVYTIDSTDGDLYGLNAAGKSWTKLLTITTFQGFGYDPTTGILLIKADGNYYSLINGALSGATAMGVLGWSVEQAPAYKSVLVRTTGTGIITAGANIFQSIHGHMRKVAITHTNAGVLNYPALDAGTIQMLNQLTGGGYNFLYDGTNLKSVIVIGRMEPSIDGVMCSLYLYDFTTDTSIILGTDIPLVGCSNNAGAIIPDNYLPLTVCTAKIIGGSRIKVFLAHACDMRLAVGTYVTCQITSIELPYCGA